MFSRRGCYLLPCRHCLPTAKAELSPHSAGESGSQGNEIVLPDDRLVVGTVEKVKDGQVKVNTGQLMPRYLLLHEAIDDKMRPLIRGDLVEIWVNAQDLVVDYHPIDELGWHRILRGSLVQSLPVDQECVVIKGDRGKEEAYAVRPLARSKVAAMPIGSCALFLVDKANKIVDATFGDDKALRQAIEEWRGLQPVAPKR